MAGAEIRQAEVVEIASLKPHERNYRVHPEDQLAHIERSLQEHGVYRNIVVARDGTILAGHGVVEAAKRIGLETIPVIRLDVGPDDPEAIRVLTGDNELGRFAESDDRALAELLKGLREQEDGLLGTGYDEMMLANLALVTRASAEIADFDAAAHWVGLPGGYGTPEAFQVVVSCETEADRAAFMEKIGAEVVQKKTGRVLSIWYPEKPKEDLQSLRFDDAAE